MSELDHAVLPEFFDRLCVAAAGETLPRFRSNTRVHNKLSGGFDPVTEADRAAEKILRDLIQARFPDHGIHGEEFGNHNPEARYQWVIDPIDGTRAFISGLPVWGTLIGLYDHGRPVAGVMDQPFTGERFVATGGKSWAVSRGNPNRALETSSVDRLESATLMTTSPHILLEPQDAGYFRVEQAVQLFRYGCDCYAYCMLASGYVDLVIETGLNPYDIAALIPIIENAGGVVTTWDGGTAARGGQIVAAANSELHAQAVALLQG